MKIRIDLHVHTNRSPCALLTPETIIRTARRRGLGAVAVTDHNSIAGALQVRSLARSLKVIVGEEIKTAEGEIIGYFLQEEIPPFLSPGETMQEIRRQGGLVSVPHPFDRLRSSRLNRQALVEIIQDIDMIEVFNARDILLRKEQKLIDEALKHGAVPIVASDAHLSIEIGRAVMEIEDFDTTRQFLHNLKQARPIARKSPLWVHCATKLYKPLRKKTGK